MKLSKLGIDQVIFLRENCENVALLAGKQCLPFNAPMATCQTHWNIYNLLDVCSLFLMASAGWLLKQIIWSYRVWIHHFFIKNIYLSSLYLFFFYSKMPYNNIWLLINDPDHYVNWNYIMITLSFSTLLFEMYIWIHSSLILKNALWIFLFFKILLTKEEIETQ